MNHQILKTMNLLVRMKMKTLRKMKLLMPFMKLKKRWKATKIVMRKLAMGSLTMIRYLAAKRKKRRRRLKSIHKKAEAKKFLI